MKPFTFFLDKRMAHFFPKKCDVKLANVIDVLNKMETVDACSIGTKNRKKKRQFPKFLTNTFSLFLSFFILQHLSC